MFLSLNVSLEFIYVVTNVEIYGLLLRPFFRALTDAKIMQ